MDFMSKNFDLEENIFFFHNGDIEPLEMVLDLDTKDKFFFNLLNRFFADVIDEPNEHSMVLANPDMTTYYHSNIPAFNIQYIEDCFKFKTFPDPSKYCIKSSYPYNYTKDQIMDCWFYKTKSWFDLMPVQDNDDYQSETSEIESPSIISSHLKSDNDENQHLKNKATSSTRPINCSSSPNKQTRMPYTHNEDKDIVKYIIEHKYAFEVFGTQMWKMMERSKVCKIRTWQSMKERYIKHIKYDIKPESSKYPFLSPSDITLLRQGLNIDPVGRRDREKLQLKFRDERMEDLSSD